MVSTREETQHFHQPGAGPRATGQITAWLKRPAGVAVVIALTVFILAVPAWLMADELRYSALLGDDFVYIAEALDWPTTRAHLFEPHNTHVVPLFRLWTAAIVAVAGSLEAMPTTFRAASYFGLIVAMVAVFTLVVRETGRTGLGLAAMAGMGLSTVVQPAVSWYSAGQALWAGTGIVVTLILAQAWSRCGGVWRLALVVLAALAAPAIWSGGLLAGPAAAAYIRTRHPAKYRGPFAAMIVVAALAAVIVVGLSRGQISNNKVWEHHQELWPRPVQAWLHTFQGITETLILANLGLDAVTAPAQAIALVAVLAGTWFWSRGGFRGLHPLETSGAVVVVGSYWLVYFFRGNFPYSSLRDLGWYNAIPQIGAALFAAGWWQSLRPDLPHALTRFEAIIVLGIVGLLCVLRVPLAERKLLQYAPPLSASERRSFPIPELQRFRALYFKEEVLGRQVHTLAKLDKAESVVARMNIGPETLRRIYGRVLVPGIPELQTQSDAFSLLKLPPDGPDRPPDVRKIHLALDALIRPEQEPRPPWLKPDDIWPRP